MQKWLLLLWVVVSTGAAYAKPTLSPDENLSNALVAATGKIDCVDQEICRPSVSRLKCTRATIESTRHCEFTDSKGKTQKISGRNAGALFEVLRVHPDLTAYCQKNNCGKLIEIAEVSCENVRDNGEILGKPDCRIKLNSLEAKSTSGPVQLITPEEASLPGGGAK